VVLGSPLCRIIAVPTRCQRFAFSCARIRLAVQPDASSVRTRTTVSAPYSAGSRRDAEAAAVSIRRSSRAEASVGPGRSELWTTRRAPGADVVSPGAGCGTSSRKIAEC
jgi:hypothetical protein